MKGFTLGLALKQRRKATQKLPILSLSIIVPFLKKIEIENAILFYIALSKHKQSWENMCISVKGQTTLQ